MDKALQTMIGNMPEKTGNSLDEWKKLLSLQNFSKHSEAVNFLKKEHDVSHGFANAIVTLSKQDASSEKNLIEFQYKGKESLFSIYEKLIETVKELGNDISITPKKTSVSVIRKKQFVLIKPATKNRIDLGFKLKDFSYTDRLLDSGPFGTMCTHRVQLTDESDVNEELKSWIKKAYDQSI